MNFLAHGWLARGGNDDFLYGNLIADGVKGVDLDAWGSGVAAGIRHHRRVDAYIDRHPVLLEVKARAPRDGRRVAGIALDLMWDHCLARRLTVVERDWLVSRCYRLLETRPAPARLATMMPALVRQDWLRGYADFGFTCRAVAGLGRRLSGPNRLAALLPWLERDYLALDEAFTRLWPDLEAHLEVSVEPGVADSVGTQPQAADRIAGRH
ncbi:MULTISPECIES: acyl carrier protein phosphodiesterase [Halomonas]|uniref:ACP phosphodiesterase n=1 Tax=Halomonas halophila TaxID=29573 RepID=A0ABQ0U8S1_9GAMM|nr:MULTISPECIES: ACP phosphodiesterase [Halomonas]MDR5888434.1 ACP phosphodiesterase [Halomonas salina]WJY05777.1 ACP phosphodiesterase [Halomonas halophila]GEK74128.1 ACP phosphodiesterase [Halomonas halophila]